MLGGGGTISSLSYALYLRVGAYIKQRNKATLFFLLMGGLIAMLMFMMDGF